MHILVFQQLYSVKTSWNITVPIFRQDMKGDILHRGSFPFIKEYPYAIHILFVFKKILRQYIQTIGSCISCWIMNHSGSCDIPRHVEKVDDKWIKVAQFVCIEPPKSCFENFWMILILHGREHTADDGTREPIIQSDFLASHKNMNCLRV